MKKYKRGITIDELQAACDAQGLHLNRHLYDTQGYDYVVVSGGGARVVFNTFNGHFSGTTPDGTEFDSDKTDHDHEPWMQGLLDFFNTDAPTLEELVLNMKQDIRACITNRHIPANITSFGELDNYIDANCLGGLCTDEVADALIKHFGGRDEHEGMPQAMCDFINEAQRQVDAWLKGGRK